MSASQFRTAVVTLTLILCWLNDGCNGGQDSAHKDWLVPAGRKQVVVQDTGVDAARRVVIENGFLRLVINPSVGGRVESFVHKKSGNDLTLPLAETVPGGLLSEGVWQQDYWRGDWNRSPYAVKIVEQTPELVKLALSSPTGKNWTGVSFSKTLTVRAGSSAVQVDYTIAADDKVDKHCKPDLHFHQALASHGKVFLPSESGVLTKPLSAETESWVWDPARGWAGFIADNGTGLAATFDFKRIRALRTSDSPGKTLEWILRKTELKAGTSQNTPVRLAAFAGLKEVSAVGDRLAAELRVGEFKDGKADVRLAFAPFESFRGKVSLAVRPMSGGDAVSVLDRNMSFDIDQPAELKASVKLAGEGNWVVVATVHAEGMPDLVAEKPVFAPTGHGTYAMAPESPRIPEVGDGPTWARYKPIDLNFNSTAIPTPHRTWAKKWAAGRPRVLALLPEGGEREAVEMMQRFDMDITCAYLCQNTYYVLGDGVRSLRQETVNANAEKTLEGNFDVVTISLNDTWPLLTPKAKARLVEMVKNGTGLVAFQRGAPPEEFKEYLPLEFINYDGATGFYTLVTNSPPVLAAFPYAAMPLAFYSNGSRMRMRPDSTNTPMGTVLLKAVLPGSYPERGPLVALGQMGKGRLVQAQIEGDLVPPYGKFVSIHVPDAKTPNYDYWEYHYAMVARLVYWASHKESPVSLMDVGASNEVQVTLGSQVAGSALLDLTLRDPFGEVLEKKTQPIDLKTGAGQTFIVPISGSFAGTARIADVIISNDKGVLAFGGGAFPVNNVHFTKLAPEKPMYLPTDTATIVATITNEIPQGAVVRAQLYDGSHRMVATAESPAATETKLSLPLARVIGPIYEVRAALVSGGTVLDQTSCEARIKATRNYETYKACYWGGVGGGEPENIIDAEFRLYQAMGMNSEFEGEGPLWHDALFLQRLNMPYTGGALGMYTVGGVTKEQAATNTVEVGNAVNSPTAFETYRTNAAARGVKWKDDDILMYSCGDENRGSGKDVDFSEQGKRALRAWLKDTQYKSLADLNTEWGSQFKTWDDVIAMSEAEAREHLKTAKTCAPWLDQRHYMTWGAARLAKSITDGVRETDPTALVGESGSEEPAVYGTDRDWWYMSKSYTALAAYGGEQTIEQESYNPTLIRYKWAGYGKPNPLNRVAFYNIMGRYDRGIAVFAARSHIDPDFTLSEPGRDVRGVLLELKRGIGQMLVSAKPSYDPVFILQSQSSIYGGYMLGLSDLVSSSRATVMQLIDDLGIEYQYISYEQVANGELKNAHCRVLFLPATVALSPAEVLAIREWVKAGGTLVADLKTALMTGHGRMYPKPELDDVFGLDRSQAELTGSDADSPWTGNDENGQPVLQIKSVERGITGTAKAIGAVTGARGTVPIVYHNAFGKGHAYYFAADIFGAYTTATGKPEDTSSVAKIQFIQALFDKMLGEAGVTPQINVFLRDPKTGKPTGRCPWLLTGAKRAGNNRFFIVQRSYAVMDAALGDIPVTVTFSEPGVIYDVVTGQLLGEGDSVDLTMMNATSRVLAVLPSAVRAVEAKVPQGTAKPGDDVAIPVEVKLAAASGDTRVLHVDVVQPDGTPHGRYSKDLICPGGKGTLMIPFALNDPKGDWGAKVTDVASGVTKSFTVSLK